MFGSGKVKQDILKHVSGQFSFEPEDSTAAQRKQTQEYN